jgi:hypothetical protein
MRTLSATLLAAQKIGNRPLIRVVLTKSGETTYTYTLYDSTPRLFSLPHIELPYNQQAIIGLKNQGGDLTSISFSGYTATISYGYIGASGEEYSAAAPLYVIASDFLSNRGNLELKLTAVGIPNIMGMDKASEAYIPASTDASTIKDLMLKVAGSTAGGVADHDVLLTCFDRANVTAYGVVFDSEDALIDTFVPADAFRISKNGSRLDAFKRLIEYTGCVCRVESDGKWHVFTPVTTGTTYDSEYSHTAGEQTFFAKTYNTSIVNPGYVQVDSRESDGDGYTGYAQDTDTPAALRKSEYIELRLTSNAQATAIATARLLHHQIDSEKGTGSVTLNVGAECYDYVKITDATEGDNRIGNVGQVMRYFSKGNLRMDFRFGGIELGTGMALSSDAGGGSVDYGSYIQTLFENDQRMLDIIEGVLTKELVLDQQWTYGTGYDPSDKRRVFTAEPTVPYDVGDLWLDGTVVKRCTTARASGSYTAGDWVYIDLDEITDGVSYKRVASASLNASGLVLLDATVEGTYGLVATADLTAHHLNLTSSTYIDGVAQATVGVWIDASVGITIKGGKLYLKDSAGNNGRSLYVDTNGYLRTGVLGADKFNACLPDTTDTRYCGTATYTWGYGYFNNMVIDGSLIVPAVA